MFTYAYQFRGGAVHLDHRFHDTTASPLILKESTMTGQPLTVGDLRRALDELPDDMPVRALITAPGADYAELHVLATARTDQMTVTWCSGLVYEGRPYLRLNLRPQEGAECHTLTGPATT
ncbi:hypothetical protein [Nocardiopsis quinghaiensis]|uniref:hypothetical protein n=1 Tax=Nocardiopsis quinghaiensis TaxID=464995 RepID=UPI00123B6021|nr:hypothetical protein [Nocardiopsis quinghaiensis]